MASEMAFPVKDMIFGVAGGLGLFLFGMKIMSDGLKKVAGPKLKQILESLTKHRIIAILVGAVVTALIQSSSATTVITVGFINAGLLTLKQALCVVLGANIGTTFTAWLVSTLGIGSLKITAYAMPAIGIGFLMQVTSHKQRIKNIGSILLGFGILFVGISFMKDAFEPVKGSEQIQQWLVWLGKNPILAVMAGTVITVLLQSSSASIMIIQVLAWQGAFGTGDWHQVLQITIPFILGDNIGTTITAQIAALQANRNAKRVAMGHTIFNVLGVLYMVPLVSSGWYVGLIEKISPFALGKATIMVHIAIAHSTFNVFNTIVFTPIIKWLEFVVIKIIPVKEAEKLDKPAILERHLLDTPSIAVQQAKSELVRMAKAAVSCVNQSMDGLKNSDRKKLARVRKTEEAIDNFQFEITTYLAELSTRKLSEGIAAEVPVLLHAVNDLERVGDHAVNIVELAERKMEQKFQFGNEAIQESEQLHREINSMLNAVMKALVDNDKEAAEKAIEYEKTLNQMQRDFRKTHVKRMTQGKCNAVAGLIFIDLVDNVEKMGDHLTNIAQAVIGDALG